jgi:hypothetical protein
MKLSQYAKQQGISYSTALRWWHQGAIRGYRVGKLVKEVGSGVNDDRPKLWSLLSDPRFATIDQAAFASKNLYNQANYQIRQAFIHEGKYLPYAAIFHRLKHHEAYSALPRKVSNSILIQLHQNWIAFFKEMHAYREDPSNFLGSPGSGAHHPSRFLLCGRGSVSKSRTTSNAPSTSAV